MWRYVALSKKLENCSFPGFLVFGPNLEKRLWHYVALCGAIPKKLKIAFFPVFSFLDKTWKKGCGTMWRYVALCGAIPKSLKIAFFPVFSFLGKTWKKGSGTMWRYVALSQKA